MYKFYSKSVFINCPFDGAYQRIFDAMVFAISDCGFIPRSAKEAGDDVRLNRIIQIIKESKYAIHDISRAGLDKETNLARFNMPLELGIFIGALKFGTGNQKQKTFVIFDRDRYRYLEFISDLRGYDPKAHNNKPDKAIINVRNWLNSITNPNYMIPSGSIITTRYNKFKKELPLFAEDFSLRKDELEYQDYCFLVEAWLQQKAS